MPRTEVVTAIAWMGKALLWLAILTANVPAPAATDARAPVIAAAASVRFALEDLAEIFYRQTGQRVRLSLGSSGNLARQIREGAPYELYLAAEPRYVEDLARDGFTRGDGKNYLLGRLVVFVPRGSPLAADGSLDDLRAALADGRVKRFAIANPEHAPYGRGAEQALRRAGLWDAIRERLVLGENVGQAAQFAASGNAEGGIIGLALARAPAVAGRGSAALIPRRWYAPLRHRAVLLNSAGPVAQRFFDYLSSATARGVFRKHGFDLPGDAD
jgi:molybdate transport system substrate-binding protein